MAYTTKMQRERDGQWTIGRDGAALMEVQRFDEGLYRYQWHITDAGRDAFRPTLSSGWARSLKSCRLILEAMLRDEFERWVREVQR